MMKKARLLMVFALGIVVGVALTAQVSGHAMAQAAQPIVSGIGGIFFKAEDPSELRAWYDRHLGIDAEQFGVNFVWLREDDPELFGMTVWSVFSRETEYFGDGDQEFMINYRVTDLDALLGSLREQGVQQLGETEDYWYGRFAWIADGEGNRIELWEPVDMTLEEYNRRLQEGSD